MSDRILAIAGLGVSVLIGVQMYFLDVPFAYEPLGPKAFPLVLAGLMAACCVALLLNPASDMRLPDRRQVKRSVLLFSALLAYGVLFEWLGFPLATALMAIALGLLFGGRIVPAVLAGVTLGAGAYLFFDRLLQVSLPLGRIWDLA